MKEERIVTKIFNYGNEDESKWPPKYGTGGGSGVFYYDKETRTMKEGYPPNQNKKYGEAPYIILDEMEPYRHPATGQVLTSKKALAETDKACGTFTTDKQQITDGSVQRARKKARAEDSKKALLKAVAMVDSGTAPLSEETRALCDIQNEIVSSALNMDAFNVVGRKNNGKGKRFRRK